MRKILLEGILAVLIIFCAARSHATPLDIPTGGGRIIAPSTFTANGYFSGKSNTSVALSTPVAGYGYCINHVVVTAPSAGLFEMWWSTSTTTSGTTDYMATVAAGVPYDTQWGSRTPYCSPPDTLLNLFLGVSGSTMTFEGYTFKGWN